MLRIRGNQDKPKQACARLLYSEALHTLPPGQEKEVRKNNYPLSHLPEIPIFNRDVIVLALLVEGQTPLAENVISGSDKVISFLGTTVIALGVHLLSFGNNTHESPLKANKALTLM